MAIWNNIFECLSREEMTRVQNLRLTETVKNVSCSVPYYREKMKAKGIEPGDIKTIEDLKKMPFCSKQDLRDTYPYGLFATPLSEIVRLHASSGTTGKQIVVGYTRRDLATWSEVMARTLSTCGVNRNSFVQVAYGYGLFTGGLGAHYGAENIGASVIPASTGNTKRQIQLLTDFGTTHLCCTPSYALYIAEELEEQGIDKKALKLTGGAFGAEPWSENMRKEIEDKLGILAIDIYGLTEIIGPGVASGCECHTGLHVQEDHFIPEIIDPITEEVLPEGQIGELVLSTITKEGMPLLRFRTRDISSLTYGKCECGRTNVKMSRVTGRTDDMLKIRGINVFPSQIESVLLDFGDTTPNYQLFIERINQLDELEVKVEMTQSLFSDEIKQIEQIEKKIKKAIEETLSISAKVTLVDPKTIERSEGKARRVIDNRNIK